MRVSGLPRFIVILVGEKMGAEEAAAVYEEVVVVENSRWRLQLVVTILFREREKRRDLMT